MTARALPVGRALGALALAFVYVTIARRVFELSEPGSVTYWPGAGVFVAALVLCPRRRWPYVLTAIAALELGNNLLSHVGVGASLWWAGTNVLEAASGAALLGRLRARRLDDLQQIGAFVLSCVVVAPVIGGTVGAVGYLLHDADTHYAQAALRWMLGDGIGILTTAPALIVLGHSPRARRLLRTPEAVGTFLVIVALGALAFDLGSWAFVWPYLAIPPALWAAVRLGMAGAALSTLLLAHAASAATAMELGPFVVGLPANRASIAVQGFAGGLTLAMLVVGARTEETLADVRHLTAEQAASAERAQRSAALQRVAGRMAKVAGWSMEVPSRESYRSEGMGDIVGEPTTYPVPYEEGLARYIDGDEDRVEAAIEACITEGTPFDLEARFRNYAGEVLTLRLVGELERDEHGAPTRVVGALQDITAQRKQELAHRDLSERLATTLETISDGLYVLDDDLRFTFVNRRAEQVLRRDRDELVGRYVFAAFPDLADSALADAYQRALDEGTTVRLDEFRYPPLDSWFDVRVYPTPDGVAVYFQDVSQAHHAREELRERGNRLAQQAALLDEAADAIVVRDMRGRVTYWNRSAEQLYGLTASEALGRTLEELLTPVAEQARAMRQGLEENREWSGELTQRHVDGTELVVESRWSVVRDDNGRATGILIFNTDISDRKRLEAQFLRAQRLESIGTLAGGLAHDLNNALAPIVISAGLLETLDEDESRLGIIRTITTSATRASDMVRQILTFARGVEGRRAAVDLDALVDDIERITNDTFLKTIRVDRSRGAEVWPVRGDGTQLQQVLMNLAVNARDAMPEGGTLRLATDSVIVDADTAAAHDVAPGRYARVRVEDDGSGIDPALLERIFEPFFTTKAPGAGTGLGLSTSEAIVQSHGGFLTVESTPGVGTTFLVHLPADEERSGREPAPRSALPQGLGEVVVVVDDEEQVRSIVGRTLEAFGYRVIEVGSGTAAIDAVRAQPVDAVITDMMMPGMDGVATIRALWELRPDLPVIAASGVHAGNVVQQATDLGVTHFLHKPFTVTALLEELHVALDRGDAS